MMYEITLTDFEVQNVVDALEHAEEKAIGGEATAKFRQTRHEVSEQFLEQEGKKATEVEE